MKKNSLVVLVFLILQFFALGANAACDIAQFHFGSTMQDIEKKVKDMGADTLPATGTFESIETEQSLLFAGDDLCKSDSLFKGMPIEMIFLYDKLVEVRISNFLENGDTPLLVNWAEKVYGERKNKPRGFYANQPNANWLWESFSSTISYSIIGLGYGVEELVVIQSSRHQDLFKKYSEKEERK
jgi:hypothetical protein